MRSGKIKNAILTPVLMLSGLFLHGCASTNADSVSPEAELSFEKQIEQVNKQASSNETVNFKGVSLSYKAQVFGEVKAEEVPEHALQYQTDKPDGVEPQHVKFTFDSGNPNNVTSISVFPLQDFPRMYAVNESSVKYVEKEIADLKKVLKDKNYRVDNQIPYLRFIDAHQAFHSKVKHFSFQNGKGILFLTQYDIERSLINNEGLTYIYQAITKDGKYYVLGNFSVSVSFLPKDFEPGEFEGYQLPEGRFIRTDEESTQYKNYISKMTKRLENLPPEQFQPNLKYIEELISSLKIEK
jgi:hypothetical protein